MDINNQSEYWDAVAEEKTFSLPLDVAHFRKFIASDARIVDFGCGYGRTVRPLLDSGFACVTGYDTSQNMILRGRRENLPLEYISTPWDLPVPDGAADCVLVIAVLTCIPENAAQCRLVSFLERKLKPGGLLYVMDFPIQTDPQRVARYDRTLLGTPGYGVFHLPEGVTLRHHSRPWLDDLFSGLRIMEYETFPVSTMNRNPASAFRLVARKG